MSLSYTKDHNPVILLSVKACMAALALCVMLAMPGAATASKSARIGAPSAGGPRYVFRAASGDVYAACVFVPVGTAMEDKARDGITDLLNSIILNGDSVSPAASPVYAIESLGGSVEAASYSEYACFSLVAPAEVFGEALGVLADAIGSPSITDYTVLAGKRRIAAENDMAQDTPETDAYRTFLARTYEDDAYSPLTEGEAGSLAEISAGEVGEWFGEYYSRSGMVVSVVAGPSDEGTVRTVQSAFGGYETPAPEAGTTLAFAERFPVERSATYESSSRLGGSAAMLGYTAPPLGSPDYAAVKLAEAVVAEGLGSRLFRTLRGEDRLAYSFCSVMPESAGVSRLAFYVSADEEKIERAVDALKCSVDALKDGGLSDEELDRARAAVIGNISFMSDDPAGEARRAGLYELIGLGPDYADRLAEEVRELDADDVCEAANRYFDKYTLVIIKPERRLR